VTETACPFCHGALADSFHAAPAPVSLTVRLSRAALWAIGTGTISIAAACGGATTGLLPLPDDAGSPPGEDAGSPGAVDAGWSLLPEAGLGGHDGSFIAPPYGIPPPLDSGNDLLADGSPFDSPYIGLPYGGPPQP